MIGIMRVKMKLRLKKMYDNRIIRTETNAEIKEVLINEDLLHLEKEHFSVCFRGDNSSGIIDLTTKEIEQLYNSVKIKKRLIKGVKIIR